MIGLRSLADCILATLLFSLSSTPSVTAQDVVYDSTHNSTSLLGTWSSGSGNVVTGAGFANPVNFTFTYPSTTGVSYSFTTDVLSDGGSGYFEEAQYRFQGNGKWPMNYGGWLHGWYTLNANGSITLNPFAADGRQQVQDMCAAKSNIIQQFNQTTLFAGWNIVQDPSRGVPKLQLLRFDGAPLSPMYLVSQTPNMLPTTTLTNVTEGQVGPSSAGIRKTDLGLLSSLGAAVVAMALGSVVVL
ncbi:Reversal of tor2 lethality [Tulasnella sp. 403]|nr:Reversal of tor2 lethality [Tulasnella sp. 403]